MSVLGLLRIALKAFSRHRLRAALTMLGIMIGVGAFVTMVAIGRGASEQVNSRIAAMGANVLIAFGGSASFGGSRGGMGSSNSLNDEDIAAIRRECDAVKYAAPSVDSRSQVMWAGANWATSITGTTPDYLQIRSWNIARGVMFGQRDVDAASKVCVLGQVVVDELFGGDDPVGQTIRLRSLSCQVVGVLARKGQGGMGQDYDDIIMMPITTLRRKFFSAAGRTSQGVGRADSSSSVGSSSGSGGSSVGGATSNANYVNRIYMSAVSARDTVRASTQVLELLRQRKRTREGDPDDPTVRDMTEFAEVAQETSRTMTLLLAGIAAVSLIVGGIGIMNIMLVSVTERTREIGIRMAVGAKGRYILLQFLLEAMVLTIGGGLIGMALGTGAAKVFADAMQWPTALGVESYAIGFSFSTLVGVVFGFYPAWRASRLDPIEALRYE